MVELKPPEKVLGVPTETIFAMIVVALALAFIVPRFKVEDLLPAEAKGNALIVGVAYVVAGVVVMAVGFKWVKNEWIRAGVVGVGGGFVIAGVIKSLPSGE